MNIWIEEMWRYLISIKFIHINHYYIFHFYNNDNKFENYYKLTFLLLVCFTN